jgi:hypothetical protein
MEDCGEFFYRALQYLYEGKGTLEDFEGDLCDVASYLEIAMPLNEIRKTLD